MENLTERYRLTCCILSVKVYISQWHKFYFSTELGNMIEGNGVRFPSGCIRHG